MRSGYTSHTRRRHVFPTRFMEPIDTLIAARWIVPIEPDGRVLEDHAVAIHRGLVVAVQPTREARVRFAADELIERYQHAASDLSLVQTTAGSNAPGGRLSLGPPRARRATGRSPRAS